MSAPVFNPLTRHRLWSSPDSQESPIVERRITEKENELEQIEIQFQSIQSRLEALRRELTQLHHRKVTLRKDLAAHQALLAPIRTLPLELLSEIFSLLYTPIEIRYDEEREKIGDEGSDDDYESDEDDYDTVGYASFKGPPTTISRVCSTWNSVFRHSPSAWSHITLHLHLSEFRSNSGLLYSWHMRRIKNALSTALARSMEAPLHICLDISEEGRQDLIPELASLLSCVLEYKDHWKTADIAIDLEDHALLEQLCAPMPALEALSLTLFSEEKVNTLFHQSPSLQTVTFGTVPAFLKSKLAWGSLHHLIFRIESQSSSISMSDVKGALSQCKSLRSLSWDSWALVDDSSGYKRPATLPVTSLVGGQSIDDLLPLLHLPNLTTFELYVEQRDSANNILSPVQEEYRSVITTLHVASVQCSTDTLFTQIGNFPQLQTLKLKLEHFGKASASGYTFEDTPHRLPKLRTMTVTTSGSSVFVSVFNDVVSLLKAFQRAMPDNSVGSPLHTSALEKVELLFLYEKLTREQRLILDNIQQRGLHLEVREWRTGPLVVLGDD